MVKKENIYFEAYIQLVNEILEILQDQKLLLFTAELEAEFSKWRPDRVHDNNTRSVLRFLCNNI